MQTLILIYFWSNVYLDPLSWHDFSFELLKFAGFQIDPPTWQKLFHSTLYVDMEQRLKVS